MAEDRRVPKNLQGLLRFCTERTKVEDTTGPSSMEPMTEERKKFLRDAIEAMTENDPVKRMLENVEILLKDKSKDSIEKREGALEDLKNYCEDLDLANDFHRIGGFHILADLLRSEHDGFRWRTADLIATLAQNNPYCQKEIINGSFLPLLFELLDDTNELDIVRIKALYAISCVTRENPEGQDVFVSLDGFSFLLRAMLSDIEKLQIKSVFMFGALCREHNRFKDIICDMGLAEAFIVLLSKEHTSSFHDQLVMALLSFIEGHQRAIEECRKPQLGLREVLEAKKSSLLGKEDECEELEFVNQLYNICFSDSQESSKAER